jgi:hypothetical protein
MVFFQYMPADEQPDAGTVRKDRKRKEDRWFGNIGFIVRDVPAIQKRHDYDGAKRREINGLV